MRRRPDTTVRLRRGLLSLLFMGLFLLNAKEAHAKTTGEQMYRDGIVTYRKGLRLQQVGLIGMGGLSLFLLSNDPPVDNALYVHGALLSYGTMVAGSAMTTSGILRSRLGVEVMGGNVSKRYGVSSAVIPPLPILHPWLASRQKAVNDAEYRRLQAARAGDKSDISAGDLQRPVQASHGPPAPALVIQIAPALVDRRPGLQVFGRF